MTPRKNVHSKILKKKYLGEKSLRAANLAEGMEIT